MSVQIVHDKYDLITVRVADIHQVLDLLSPVNGCAVFPDAYMPHAAQRLREHKYATGIISDIFGINFLSITWAHR